MRVVDDNVTSSRPGATGNETPVQTYRTDAGTGTAAAVTNEVGGTNPAGQDAPANTTNANLGSILAQSKAPVRIVAGTTVTGVDFGFNFDTVVNTNNTGQGSLRQFLTNANTLGGDASLAQSGLVAAKENAVFMISNGTAAAGLRAANNYFSGGIATITPTSALPTISTPMVLNAQKQPGWTLAPIVELNGTGAGAAGTNGLYRHRRRHYDQRPHHQPFRRRRAGERHSHPDQRREHRSPDATSERMRRVAQSRPTRCTASSSTTRRITGSAAQPRRSGTSCPETRPTASRSPVRLQPATPSAATTSA